MSNLSELSDDELRKELIKFGQNPGPIVVATRAAYIKRLQRLRKESTNSNVSFCKLWLWFQNFIYHSSTNITEIKICNFSLRILFIICETKVPIVL